jgi:predicted Zn-dependent protease
MNNSRVILVPFFLVVFVFFISCSKNTLTGKSQLSFIPEKEMQSMSLTQYKDFLKTHEVLSPQKDANAAIVQKVGARITKAIERYFKNNNNSAALTGYNWEYNLVNDKLVNAWCMPGGKIVVYSGILPITKDEAGLATVLGHEVSHALANHGQQRMSAGLLQQLGAAGVGVAVGSKSEQTQQIAMTAYGAATQYGGMLPFSRSHESEADKIGLTLMAIAGYNPEQSVVFWERMAANSASSGKGLAEFASTHPSDATRIADLKALIPQAKAEAAKFGVNFK